MSTGKLLTTLHADAWALLLRRNTKNIWSGGPKALSAVMYWITAIFALLFGLQAHAQRQEEVPTPSAAFIQAVADCAGTPAASDTWPGSGRWSDPAFPGHGWELTWYTPEEAFSLSMKARLRLHFYTYTAYTGGQNPGDPVVGYPVWYYADLLPDVYAQIGLVYATGPMYKVTRDQNGAEAQTQVATVFVGQDNPATTGGIARSRATVVVNGFSDPDAPSNPGSRTLCLHKLGATATSGAYGTGQEATWRSGAGTVRNSANSKARKPGQPPLR